MLIRMKAGESEIQLESDNQLSGDVIEQALVLLQRIVNIPYPTNRPDRISSYEDGDREQLDVSLNTIVARQGSVSAKSIIRSAAIYLSVVEGKTIFSRVELASKTQEARDWQASFKTNFSRDVKKMVEAKELLEKSNGQLSLPSRALDEARKVLADG